MCIIKTRYTPYNNSNIRWKALKLTHNDKLCSMIKAEIWNVGKRKRAKNRSIGASTEDIGIHVFITKHDAINEAQYHIDYNGFVTVVAKVEVNNFNAAGKHIDDDTRNETWKYAKILEIYTPSGRYNITKRFI